MHEKENGAATSKIGNQLQTNPLFIVGEILLMFTAILALMKLTLPLAGENPLFKQFIAGLANVLMLVYIWVGLKLRGETWKDFGLTFKPISLKEGLKTFLISLLVSALGAAGFIVGSIIMVNITDIPENADMSGYNYLKNNLGMLFLALGSVYIVSSFAEEVIYRAFLINRITAIGQKKKNAIYVAVMLSSFIFGLIHYEWGPMGMVQTGFMGLAMGICYITFKKRLWILILAHGYLDTILLVQLYLADK